MTEPRIILIYVPTATAVCRTLVPPGSAIVGGGAMFNAMLVLDYEPPTLWRRLPLSEVPGSALNDAPGAEHVARVAQRFSERVRIAVARYVSQYPTDLRFRASRADLIPVGVYLNASTELEHNGVISVTDYLALENWLEEART